MALTPEGTPYVESTDLVANYPAASLSLANRVDLVGVLPFATSAARATAIPSPTDGQYSYLQDSNSTEFWNGSAWVAAGVSPGLAHVITTTFTTQASVSLDNAFTSTYRNYRILINVTASVGNENFLVMRLRASGSDTSANYKSIRSFAYATNVGSAEDVTGTDEWFLGSMDDNYTPSSFSFDVFSPQIAATTGYVGSSAGAPNANNVMLSQFGGRQTNSTAFDGLTIFPTSSTITGSIRIYGYKD